MTDDAYPRCTLKLRARGLVYPRTCAECGLGPCKTLASIPPAPNATSDLVHYGIHITQDGKRIAPEDFYAVAPLSPEKP